MYTTAFINDMLDRSIPAGSPQLKLAAHTDYSATGANVHGTKMDAVFGAASSRSKSLSTAVDIAITATVTIKWIGLWSADGSTFYGMQPNGGTDYSFQIDVTNNRIYVEGSGYANNDKVVFHNDTAPGGLTAGTTYFVVGVTSGDPDYFQVALTQGGSAIDITSQAAAACVVSKIVEETYSSNGTHRISTFVVNI